MYIFYLGFNLDKGASLYIVILTSQVDLNLTYFTFCPYVISFLQPTH